MSRPRSMHALLPIGLLAAAAGLAPAQATAAARSGKRAAAAARCHRRAHHRCPRHHAFVPDEGTFSSKPTEENQPYVEITTAIHPLRANGRARLLYTCQPSGAQALLYSGISQSNIRFSGAGFRSTAPVIGQVELIEEATAGTVSVSVRFTSRSAATVTIQLSGVAMPRIYPIGEVPAVEAPQTCSAGPVTFKLTEVRQHFGPPLR